MVLCTGTGTCRQVTSKLKITCIFTVDFSNELLKLSVLIWENKCLIEMHWYIGPKIPNWPISIDPVFEKCFSFGPNFRTLNFINGFSNKQVRENE